MKSITILFVSIIFLLSSCARSIRDQELNLGTGLSVPVYVYADVGLANKPFLKFNTTTSKWEFSNDGLASNEFGSGGGGIPTMAKGSLVTSNGTVNGELAVGTDGQILVADSIEVSGLKWVDLPSSNPQPVFEGTYDVQFITTDPASNIIFTGETINITAGADVRVELVTVDSISSSGVSQWGQSTSGSPTNNLDCVNLSNVASYVQTTVYAKDNDSGNTRELLRNNITSLPGFDVNNSSCQMQFRVGCSGTTYLNDADNDGVIDLEVSLSRFQGGALTQSVSSFECSIKVYEE